MYGIGWQLEKKNMQRIYSVSSGKSHDVTTNTNKWFGFAVRTIPNSLQKSSVKKSQTMSLDDQVKQEHKNLRPCDPGLSKYEISSLPACLDYRDPPASNHGALKEKTVARPPP